MRPEAAKVRLQVYQFQDQKGEAMSSEKQAFELARFVATLKENLPAHMELAELNAKLTHKKYAAFIKEGFTPDQALQLCKS